MKYSKKNLAWLLSELALAEPEEYESGLMEIIGEDEQGREGSCEIEISGLAFAASKRIEELESAIKQTIGFIESTNSIKPEDGGESLRLLHEAVERQGENISEDIIAIEDTQNRITELENALHEIGTLAEHGKLEFYAVTSIITSALPD